MPIRFFLGLLILLLGYLFLASTPVSAGQLVINEFLVNPTTPRKEWVEFYNPEHADLTTYWLDDDTLFATDSGNSSKKGLSSLNLANPDFPYLEFSPFLNNDGDYVVLFSNDGTIIDQYQYTSNPGKDVSLGRSPDGGQWAVLSTTTPGNSNGSPVPSSTKTPSPAPTPPTATAETPEEETPPPPIKAATTAAAVDSSPEPEINLVLGSQSGQEEATTPAEVPPPPKATDNSWLVISILLTAGAGFLGGAGYFLFRGKFWEKWPLPV